MSGRFLCSENVQIIADREATFDRDNRLTFFEAWKIEFEERLHFCSKVEQLAASVFAPKFVWWCMAVSVVHGG
jgi:hypothetical protein